MNSAQGSLRVSRKIKPIDGTNGVSYELRTSIESVYLNPDGTPKDASFTASLYYISGDSNPTNIHCEMFLNGNIIGSGTSFTIPTSNLRTIYKLTAKVDGVIATEKAIGIVKDGADSYVIDLTNNNSTVNCDKDGNVVGTLQSTQANVYKGGTLDTGWVFTINNADGATCTINNGLVTVTSIIKDVTAIEIKATKNGFSDKYIIYTITKVYAGANGDAAISYWLIPSANAISRNKSGVLMPVSITIIKMKQVGSQSAAETTDGILTYLASNNDTGVISSALNINANWSYVDIIYTIDNVIVDQERIPIITDGLDGLGISSIVKTYNVSASQDTQPTVWLSSIPTMNETSGKYLWMKTVTTYTDNSSITEIHIAAVYGDRGIDSNLLDWVNDWNSTATTIGTNYICSPKAFFGTVNHSNNTITGIALGNIINGYNGISAFNSLGENTFYLDTDGNVKAKGEINATSGIFENVTINESCNVKGTLNGVTGSFKSLDCINTEGVKMGSISFGDDGKIWFDGKMLHQGPGALFYMSNAWIRSDFGAATRNMAYVSGNTIRFKSVLGDQVDAMTQNTDSSGRSYYDVPTYGTNGYANGMPLDEIIIELSSSPIIDKFNIVMYNTRRVLLINSNNNKSLYIYSNGNLVEIVGGAVCELVQVDPSYMSPTPTYGVLGRGLLIGGIKDNNW